MRPLSLRIQGIGPFAGEEYIPFEELGENGLYLVSGDTGAGKTTIFDAICFALFGKVSGEVRDSATLRSDYAQPSQESRVTLVFSQSGENYTVVRMPSYLRPKLRGKGTVMSTAWACLTLPDGSQIEGEREVTAHIEELLGLDREQFKQTAMLAQGEFLRLLLANTKERSEIFRKIFGTEIYSELQERLRQETVMRRTDCEEAEKSIRRELSGIELACEDADCPTTQDIRRHMEGDCLYEAGNLLKLLKEWLSDRKICLEKHKTESRQLDELADQVNQGISRLSQENMRRRQLEDEEQKLARHKIQEAAQKKEADFLAQAERTERICRPAWDRKEQAQEAFILQRKRLEKMQEKKEALSLELPRLEKALRQSQEGENRRREQAEELSRRTAVLPARKDACQSLLRIRQEQTKAEEMMNREQASYERQEKIYRKCNSEYESLELSFYREQAGLLAAGLAEGQPCPVCGSLEHPAPAVLSGEAVKEEQVRQAKKTVDDARDVLQTLSLRLSERKTVLEQLRVRCDEAYVRLDGWDEMRIRAEEQDIAQKQHALQAEEEQAARCAREYAECERQLLPLDGELENQRKQVDEAERNREEAEKCWRVCLQEAGLNEEEEYHRFLLSQQERQRREAACGQYRDEGLRLEAGIQKLKEALDKDRHQKRAEGYVQLLHACDNVCKEENAALYDPDDLEKLENCLQNSNARLIQKRRAMTEADAALGHRIAVNERIAERLERELTEYGKRKRQWELYADLSSTAGGELKGQEKLAFEQYVQAFYFEQIVDQANRRLIRMSSGRYELSRVSEAATRRSRAGLELEVTDYYTGKKRPVSSLSGGEAFQASLSLALGLSDVVQNMTGGVRIETMFVDEGFGSLDREAMDLAVGTLKELAQENFLVGIISHVEELKERIPKKILVEKQDKGSHIRLVIS